MEVQQRLLDQQKELCLGLVHNKPRIEEQSLNSMHVIKTLVSHQNVDETATKAIAAGVKGYKALLRSQDGLAPSSSISDMFAFARGPDSLTCLEQDFTTNGAQGNLDCPFSKPQTPVATDAMDGGPGPPVQADICGNDDLDPIKAEQDERRSSTTPSARTSQSQCIERCPIRFLNKHSPEEITEFVERHKHELPRSHITCLNRFQKDPQNIDAKYGGFANVISGLSIKHQPYLRHHEGNTVISDKRESADSSTSTQRVEKWAENVDPVAPGLNPATPIEHEHDDDNRESRFDRPLREVRLGESPSRPWGMHVPITAQQVNAPAPISGSVPDPMGADISPLEKAPTEAPAKPAGCPFGHGAPKPKAADPPAAPASNPAPASTRTPNPALLASPWANSWGRDETDDNTKAEKVEDTTAKTAKTDTTPMPSHVTFNGPVFFGYSAEQTASLLQQLRDLNPPN